MLSRLCFANAKHSRSRSNPLRLCTGSIRHPSTYIVWRIWICLSNRSPTAAPDKLSACRASLTLNALAAENPFPLTAPKLFARRMAAFSTRAMILPTSRKVSHPHRCCRSLPRCGDTMPFFRRPRRSRSVKVSPPCCAAASIPTSSSKTKD